MFASPRGHAWRIEGPGPYHVDVVSRHGKTCYVFAEEYERGDAGEQPVLLWCEAGTPQQYEFHGEIKDRS